jgi:hypothetical protein
MTLYAPPNPALDRERVNRMIDSGMSFGQVENAIEHFALPEEQKSALWMLAWSRLLDPHWQERVAEDAWGGALAEL